MLEASPESPAFEEPADPLVEVLFPSPIGELAVRIVGEAVTRLVINPTAQERVGYRPFDEMMGSEFLEEVFGRLSEYFAGARRSPELKFDLRPSALPGFARRVLRETSRIPYGRTRTYRHIAEKAGQPEAYRQVLSTLLVNPIPILVPCHRVVTNKSGIGSYVGGQEAKRWLLEMEREAVQGNGGE